MEQSMKSWRNALVKADASLEQAIEALDKAALRIALVVDDEGRLAGTLTDGDVRRALLKHRSLSTSVSQVMNTNQKTAEQGWSEIRILSML
jgi:CBS domain-containing protein